MAINEAPVPRPADAASGLFNALGVKQALLFGRRKKREIPIAAGLVYGRRSRT